MNDDQLAKVKLESYGGEWYNIGGVDLDATLTLRKEERAKRKAQKDLAEKIYGSALAGDFNKIDTKVLPEVVSLYTPRQIALMSISGTDTEEHAKQFGRIFLDMYKQYCPEKLQEANTIITQTTGKIK